MMRPDLASNVPTGDGLAESALHKASGSCTCGVNAAPGISVPVGSRLDATDPLAYFAKMIDHCYEFAEQAKAAGRPLVGIMCEFTPREIIFAAGAVPVCLCGGSAATIPAAERCLPANLCPLIKSTFGYHTLGTNPFLKWADLVVAETTCDGKKKMFELLGATKEMYVLELPQKAEDPAALENWTREVRKFKEHLERRFGTDITGAKLRDAIHLMNRERRFRRELAELMTADPPPLTGRQLQDFRSIISGIEQDLVQYENALTRFRAARTAVAPDDRSSRGIRGSDQTLGVYDVRPREPGKGDENLVSYPSATSRPRKLRVLLTGVPIVQGAERVLELVESCGAVVVAMENCTGLKPILEDVDAAAADPLRAIAEKYYHLPCSVMTPNRKRFETLRQLAARFKPDCIIELVWQACLTYDVEAVKVRDLAEQELGLPYLKVTTDYSPSDSARITARVQALFEVVRARV